MSRRRHRPPPFDVQHDHGDRSFGTSGERVLQQACQFLGRTCPRTAGCGWNRTSRYGSAEPEHKVNPVPVLDDGRLEIDKHIAERALRGVAVGPRNWLFAGSKTGGERAVTIHTVIQTCKANGVDPQAYVADVIVKIAADWPAARWSELMP